MKTECVLLFALFITISYGMVYEIPDCIKTSNIQALVRNINRLQREISANKKQLNMFDGDVANEVDFDDYMPDSGVNPLKIDIREGLRTLNNNIDSLLSQFTINEYTNSLTQETNKIADEENLPLDSLDVVIMALDVVGQKKAKRLQSVLSYACQMKTNMVGSVSSNENSNVRRRIDEILFEDMKSGMSMTTITQLTNIPSCERRKIFINAATTGAYSKNSQGWLNLAFAIRKYGSDCSVSQNDINQLINKIPCRSIRNTAINTDICLRNVDENYYLITDKYMATGSARRVFIWRHAGDRSFKSKWRVSMTSPTSLSVTLRHVDHGTYLAPAQTVSGSERPTYTTSDQSEWYFEPEGDFIYVKSALTNEYMYSIGRNFCGQRGYVSTATSKQKPNKALWEIVQC